MSSIRNLRATLFFPRRPKLTDASSILGFVGCGPDFIFGAVVPPPLSMDLSWAVLSLICPLTTARRVKRAIVALSFI